mgnify:CR=1 FL=1
MNREETLKLIELCFPDPEEAAFIKKKLDEVGLDGLNGWMMGWMMGRSLRQEMTDEHYKNGGKS